MTVDLRDQLQELCAFIDDEQSPIAVDDIRAREDTVMLIGQPARPTRPTSFGRRRWLVAVAASVFVVAAALPLLVFTVGGEPEGVSGSTEADVAPAQPPINSSASLTWSRVPYGEAGFGDGGEQRMIDVTVGGPGLVAVGSVGSADGGDAAVWTSVDGIAWSRVPHDEEVFGGEGSQWMNSVTAGGPGLVAVGSDAATGEGERYVGGPWPGRNGVAAVWTSVDGITWSRVPYDEQVFGVGGDQGMSDVTVGGPGLVAVGSVGSAEGGDAAVWISVDGIIWSRVPHDEGTFGGEEGQWMNSVTAGGPGLVAVGWKWSGLWSSRGGDDHAAVWTSVDGTTWSRVPHDEEVFGGVGFQGMNDVIADGPGLVAVGFDQPGDDVPGNPAASNAAVWTSADGITWSRIPDDVAILGGTGNQRMLSVVAGGPGLVAVGHDGGFYDSRGDAAVWTSVDGIAWSRLPHNEAVFGGAWIDSVTARGRGLVAVGERVPGDDPNDEARGSLVWLAEPAE